MPTSELIFRIVGLLVIILLMTVLVVTAWLSVSPVGAGLFSVMMLAVFISVTRAMFTDDPHGPSSHCHPGSNH